MNSQSKLEKEEWNCFLNFSFYFHLSSALSILVDPELHQRKIKSVEDHGLGVQHNELTNMEALDRLFYNQIELQNLDMKGNQKGKNKTKQKWRG